MRVAYSSSFYESKCKISERGSRKKNKELNQSAIDEGKKMVASQGLEPQQAESESAVLPLHHEAIPRTFKDGGVDGARTRNPRIDSPVR